MSEEDIIQRLRRYFNIRELVDDRTFLQHGERAWKFFDIKLLEALLVVRVGLNRPIAVNDWHIGGQYSQRGLRPNTCAIVKRYTAQDVLYLSAHTLGKAVDFKVKGMTASEVRAWILKNQHLFTFKIRLEKNFKGVEITWVHLDVFSEARNPKVYEFNA